jgi:hypothetical protein
MIRKTDNTNSSFKQATGFDSESEVKKAPKESGNSLITEIGMPALAVDNSHQRARYKDQWSTENTPKGYSPLTDVLVSQVKAREGADKTAAQQIEPANIEYP